MATFWNSRPDPLAELRKMIEERIIVQDIGEEGYRKRGQLTREIQAGYDTGRACYDWVLSLIDSLQNEQKGSEG